MWKSFAFDALSKCLKVPSPHINFLEEEGVERGRCPSD